MEPTYYKNAVIFEKTAVIADTHIGFMQRNTQSNSLTEMEWFEQEVKDIHGEFDLDVFVIAGDVFDEFTNPGDKILRAVQRVRNFLEQHNTRLVITPGNHDSKAIDWNRIATKTTPEYTTSNITILHGHKSPETISETYIVGHVHPTIRIQQQEWPCYLLGKSQYNESDVLILPAFNKFISGPSIDATYTPGVTFPFLETTFSEFQPIIWDNTSHSVRKFPKLKKFNEHL